MSADKYPCIFSRQMETIVYISPSFSNFSNSHYLSTLQCIRIARGMYILITPWSQRVNKMAAFF